MRLVKLEINLCIFVIFNKFKLIINIMLKCVLLTWIGMFHLELVLSNN